MGTFVGGGIGIFCLGWIDIIVFMCGLVRSLETSEATADKLANLLVAIGFVISGAASVLYLR